MMSVIEYLLSDGYRFKIKIIYCLIFNKNNLMNKRCLPSSFLTSSIAVFIAATSPLASSENKEIEIVEVYGTQPAETIKTSKNQITEQQVDNYQLDSFAQLTDFVPSLFISDTLVNSQVSLRGMSSGDDRSFSSSVSMYRDGVYMPRSRMSQGQWFDIEKIDILRGPQTLDYAINATAGALVLQSNKAKAKDTLTLSLSATQEFEYDSQKIQLITAGGAEQLGWRLAASTYVQDELSVENAQGAKQELTNDTIKASFVWVFSENFSTDILYSYSQFEQEGQATELVNGELNLSGDASANGLGLLDRIEQMNLGAIALGYDQWNLGGEDSLADNISHHGNDASIYSNNDFLAIKSDRKTPGVESEDHLAVLSFDWRMDSFLLKGVLGHSDNTYDQLLNSGGLAENIYYAANYEEYKQTSIQLDAYNEQTETLRWRTGLYHNQSTLFTEQPNALNLPYFFGLVTGNPPGLVQDAQFAGTPLLELMNASLYQDGMISSIYADMEWDFLPQWQLGFGLRHTIEEKDYRRNGATDGSSVYVLLADNTVGQDTNNAIINSTGASVGETSGNIRSSYTLPELRLSWAASDQILLFSRYGESAKPGGVAAAASTPLTSLEYDEETAKTFELGFSQQLSSIPLNINVVAFRTQYDDLQVKSTIIDASGPKTVINNAAEASSQGIELDSIYAVTDNLSTGISVAWLDAQYDSYQNGPCNRSQSFSTGNVPGSCDLSNQTLAFAPQWSGNWYANYSYLIGSSLKLITGFNVSFSSEYQLESALEPSLTQDDWQKLSAYVGIMSAKNVWQVLLSADNLTNENVWGGALPLNGYDLVYPESGRSVYLQLTLNL